MSGKISTAPKESLFSSPIAVIPEKHKCEDNGFTLLEILLAISLASLLAVGVLDIFFATLRNSYYLNRRSEILHQFLTGIETLVAEVQGADPESIVLLEEDAEGGYSQIQFLKDDSPDLYWFYVNADGQLIRGVRRPGYDWGRTAVAESLTGMRLVGLFTLYGQVQQFQIQLQGCLEERELQMSTTVTPGF